MRVDWIVMTALLVSSPSLQSTEMDESRLLDLFTEKQQRVQIDAMRSGLVSESGVRETSKVSLEGYMTRSDGKSVVWVNDGNTLESPRVDDLRVQSSAIGKDNRVTISVDGKAARLKPGETWIKETGKIVDNY